MVSIVLFDLDMREPLEGVGWDIERMEEEKIISVGGFLFPNFVLVVDDHLLFFVEL